MGRSADPRRQVDVEPQVAPTRHLWDSSVDTHANPHGAPLSPREPGKVVLRSDRSLDGGGWIRKRRKEGVTLSVHNAASAALNGTTEDPIMLAQGSGVRSCAEPAEQRRRPLDVREQERHGSRGRWDCSGTRIARHEPTSVRQGGRQRRFCSKLPGVRRGGAVGGSSRLAVRIGLGPWRKVEAKRRCPDEQRAPRRTRSGLAKSSMGQWVPDRVPDGRTI